MILSPLSIFAVITSSFLLGAFLSYLICFCKEDQHRNNYICQRHNENHEEVCDLRRAFYWSRHAIWRHESWARAGEQSRQWLIEETMKVNLQATITEKTTMPSDCCRDSMTRVWWEKLERDGSEYRKRVEAGEDPFQVMKDVDPTTTWRLC